MGWADALASLVELNNWWAGVLVCWRWTGGLLIVSSRGLVDLTGWRGGGLVSRVLIRRLDCKGGLVGH